MTTLDDLFNEAIAKVDNELQSGSVYPVQRSEADSVMAMFGSSSSRVQPGLELDEQSRLDIDEWARDLVSAPESSWWDRTKKSYAGGSNFSKRMGDWVATKTTDIFGDPEVGEYARDVLDYLHGELRWKDEYTGEFGLEMKRATEIYGDDYFDKDEDQIREARQGRQADLTDRWYNDIEGDSIAGTIGSEIDASVLIPFGQGVKTAGAVGATLGGFDGALYSWAQNGEVDEIDVALGAAIGGVLGAGIEGLRIGFLNYIRGHADEAIPLNAKELTDAGGVNITEEQVGTMNRILGLDDPAARLLDEDLRGKMNPWNKIDKRVTRKLATKKSWEPNNNKQTLEMTVKSDIAEKAVAEVKKAKEVDEAWLQFNKALEDMKDGDYDKALSQKSEKLIDELELGKHEEATRIYNNLDEVAKKQMYSDLEGWKNIKKSMGGVGRKQGGAMHPTLINLNQHFWSAIVGGVAGYNVGDGDQMLLGAAAGAATPIALRKLFTSGKNIKDPKEKSMWLDLQFAKGLMVVKPETVMNKMSNEGQALASHIRYADMTMKARIGNFHKNYLDAVKPISRASNLSKTQKEEVKGQIQGLLNRTVDAKSAHPLALAASKQIARDFDKVIDYAVDANVFNAKKGAALKQHAKDNGYFPRMWNEGLISTPAGREQFKEALTKGKIKIKSIDAMISHIVGDDPKVLAKKTREFYLLGAKKNGVEDAYVLNSRQANWFWEQRGKTAYVHTSSHLEKPRKIPEEFENVLKPFLIQDTEQALVAYYQDVFKRIQYAKVFGNNDQKAKRMIEDIAAKEQVNPNFLYQTYYTGKGDMNGSMFVKQQTTINQTVKKVQGQAKAFETLKLANAQMLNVWQPLVNGTTKIAAKGGANPYKMYGKALIKLLDRKTREEAVDFAMRSGAAIESTIMQASGELHAGTHSILGRELTGTPQKLFGWINQPTEFLKATGFTQIERFNRILAANMGREYALELVEKKAKQLARIDKMKGQGLGDASKQIKGVQKEINKLDDALIELGMAPEHSLDDLAKNDMILEMAGQKFSNDINFINAADQIPLAWQSPYADAIRQFKTFAFHHASFMYKNVWTPLKKGNIKPALNYFGIMAPAIGIPVDAFRRMIRNDDREYTNSQRYLNGLGSVGALGIWSDMLFTLNKFGPGTAALNIMGPALSDLAKVTGSATKLSDVDMGKTLYNTQPLVKNVDWAQSKVTGVSIKQLLEDRQKELAKKEYPTKVGGW